MSAVGEHGGTTQPVHQDQVSANKRPRILVVDDENGPRQALRLLLKEEYEVRLAVDVIAALQIVDENDIDLVITDLRMPRETGVDLLKQLKEAYPDVEVIILTGYGELETAMKAVEYGAFAYLEKPFDSNTMLQQVHAGLEKHRRELERRRLERLALEANRFDTLGRAVSGMLHDLGTPLSVIGGNIDMIIHNPTDPDVATRLTTMKSQVRHCTDIIRSTMSFLRDQPSRQTLFSLNDVVASCLEVAQPLLRRQRVAVTRDTPVDIPCCTGDFVLVRQAVLNLITNACHAMKDQDEPRDLAVSTWAEGDRACLSVADTGPGIPEASREKVFDTFFTTKGDEGTGLGLAVVKYVMRRHEGNVTLRNSPDGGALFILEFPAATRRTTESQR